MLNRELSVALATALAACGPTGSSNDGGSGNGTGEASTSELGSTTPASADVTSAAADAATSSSSSDGATATGGSTSTGVEELCPVVDDNVQTFVRVRAWDWPEIGAFSDVACDALGVDAEFGAIVFSCVYPPTRQAVEISVQVPPSMLEDQLADLPGTTDLRASFYRPEKLTGFGTCTPYCNEFALRHADGSLVLLGRVAYPVPTPEPGEAIPIPGPPWLRSGTPESEAWSLPLMDLAVRNLGCEPRDGAPGLIVPLELEIPGDDGLVHVAHAAEVHDVSVGGASFDLVVRAYNDLDPPTVNPQDTVVEFVAVRSSR